MKKGFIFRKITQDNQKYIFEVNLLRWWLFVPISLVLIFMMAWQLDTNGNPLILIPLLALGGTLLYSIWPILGPYFWAAVSGLSGDYKFRTETKPFRLIIEK